MSRRSWRHSLAVAIAMVALAWLRLALDPAAPSVAAAPSSLLPVGAEVTDRPLIAGGFSRIPRDHALTTAQNDAAISSPAQEHTHRLWLGSDQQGRDVLARLVAGAWRSLWVAMLATLFTLALGAGVGLAIWGLGKFATPPLRLGIDAALALPRLLVLLALAAILGGGVWSTALAVALISWMEVARTVDAHAQGWAGSPAMLAAVASGAARWRLVLRHLLPTTWPLLMALGAPLAGRAMLLEASLAFLGFAGSSGTDSWGRLIADGRRFLPESWVMVVVPGVVLLGACAVLSRATRRFGRQSTGV